MNFKQKIQVVFNSETLSDNNKNAFLDCNLEINPSSQQKHSNLNGDIHSVGIIQNSLAELNQNFSTKKRTLLIDADSEENPRVALIGHGKLLDYEYYTNLSDSKGSIHLGIVTKILPGLQAIFIRYKNGRNGFLPFSEIDPIYLKSFQEIESFIQDSKKIIYENEISEKFHSKKKIQETLESDAIYDVLESFDSEFKKKELDKSYDDIKNNINEDSDDYGVVYSEDTNKEILGFICIGQILMVQIVKEERGSKGASLTTFISLSGRYCIYMPNKKNKNSISKNITNLIDKKRLDLILRNLKINDNGSVFILETAIRANSKEIHEDYEILKKLWKDIKIDTYKLNKAPSIVYYEKNLIKNIFFNMNMLNIKNIIIDGQRAYENAIDFTRNHMPSFLSMIKIHDIDCPIFKYYGVDFAINKLSSNIITLKSGGYIVWNKTEALFSIDVNSGKSKDEFCIEETAFKTNLEAIAEIMIQIKLRKISGLIVIDLIGMRDPHNTKLIETTVKRLASNDKAKIQVHLVEELSIIVLSRQRLGQSLIETCGVKCLNCNGFGYVSSNEVILKRLFDDLEVEIFENASSDIHVSINKKFIDFLLNEGRKKIFEFESKFNCSLRIKINPFLDDHVHFLIEDENQNDDDFDLENSKIFKQKKKYKNLIDRNLENVIDIDEFKNNIDIENKDTIKNRYNESSENLNELNNEQSFLEFNKKNTKIQKDNISLVKEKEGNFQESRLSKDKENFEKIHFLYKIWNEWIV